jgi:hypothetical protein
MIKYTLISRPPGSIPDYEYLAKQCLENVNVPGECYTFHYDPWGVTTGIPIEQELSSYKFTTDVVYFVVFDGISGLNEFDWYSWKPGQPYEGLSFLESLCAQYPDTKFIIFTSIYGLSKLCLQPNMYFIDLPPGFANNHYELEISNHKNFESEKPCIYLNRGPSFMRLTALSYMLAKNLDKFCHVTVSNKIQEVAEKAKHFYHHVTFQMTPDERKFLDIGWQKIIHWPDINKEIQDFYFTQNRYNDNVGNWNTHLLKKYQHSFLEIIASTSFNDPINSFSEKNCHQFYSRNFPLTLTSKGGVKYLEDIGFDMFADVLDHSYDSIEDPYLRLKAVFDLNQDLLMDPDLIKSLWKKHEHRFNHNIAQIPVILEKLEHRTRQQFSGLAKTLAITNH